MKSINRWLFLGMSITGLLCGPTPAQAQPASEPIPTGSESMPPGAGEPATTRAESAPTEDEPIVADDPDKPWSQGVSAESRRVARELFLEGNRRFRIPLFAKAAEKYAAALSKWKHPAFYFNLAIAQLNLGQEVEARENLEQALKYGEEPLGGEQFKEAQRQLREVERQLGRIRVTCSTEGAEVTLDSVKLLTCPDGYEGWAKAKVHEVTAKKPGYLSEVRRVTVSSGQLHQIHLRLVTLSEATDASRRWATWKPWVVIVAGSAIAAGGGVLHRFASRNFETYDDKFLLLPCVTMPSPMSPPGCPKDDIPQGLNARLSLARRQQVISVGAYIVGGSLIATGIALLYLNRPRLKEQSGISLPINSITILPTIENDMLGVWVSVVP